MALDKQTKEFLLELALKASPNRFQPFPEYFITGNRVNTDAKVDGFIQYTEQEYDIVINLLKNIKSKQTELTFEEEILLNYIYDTKEKIAFHGNNFHKQITEYEFTYSCVKERILDAKYPERWYLYHGSPVGNWFSIMKNGIKNMSDTKYMTTGKVLGRGVYLTSDLSIACQYGRQKNVSYVAVVEIFINPEPYKKQPSVCVVPDDTMLIPRYLYKITSPSASRCVGMLEYYTKEKNKSVNLLSNNKRIQSDVAKCLQHNIVLEEVKNNIYRYTADKIYTIDLHGYPYKPPLIYADDIDNCVQIPEWNVMTKLHAILTAL